jgi:Ribbon-helix-helix protein, copG family
VRSVRLDPVLDDQVRRAAAAAGTTVSEFIRDAISERAKRALEQRTGERLADVVGSVQAGGGKARRTGKAFTDTVAERHRKR